ncbi:hypothetical protein D0C16_04700 [Cellvibrio sp. KY-GH-1]|uniref:hypothetical protein n=1 Tax=Cellvibrio sp. KY-GH-1 TaxID=2303332 RepID=UPI0012441655|nr:hypothetical protein [Cellvibrio sp. KY-GH-1]QEY15335.1 hypothetical protein D0C16_04700 [Cellvibrio sp. KY-GH-1]
MKYLNAVAFFGFILMILGLFVFGQDGDGTWWQMGLFSRVLLSWGMFGGMFLWISMLVDHFKYSRVKRKIAWGLFLVFGQMLAAAIYFVFVYSKTQKINILLMRNCLVWRKNS